MIDRRESRRNIKVAQLLVFLLFARKKLADAFNPFQGLGTHPILQIYLRLQNKVFQHRRLGFAARWRCHFRRRLGRGRRLRFVLSAMKAISDAAVGVIVNPSAQHLQALGVAGLVRIKFSRAVQRLTGLPIFAR